MSNSITLKLTGMAHGGAAVGRDRRGKPVFVPYAIPGETVRAEIVDERGSFSRAVLREVREPSPDRVAPRCPHFGVCGGCHLQQMDYAAQLRAKHAVVVDQMQRIGGFRQVPARPVLPNPRPYQYAIETSLSPTADGGLGFWAPAERRVIPVETCYLIRQPLLDLLHDIDLELPGLRKLTLRLGSDDAMLAALEVDDVEPPELEADFPVSVAIVLPDRTAASLIGDPYLVQTVKGRDLRFSPGCFFHPSIEGAELLVDAVLAYAALDGRMRVLELYSGVGLLTAFLAAQAADVVAVEANADAVADTAVNLAAFDNVSLYHSPVEAALGAFDGAPDVLVVNPPGDGLSPTAVGEILRLAAPRLVYASSEIATLARDAKQLARGGYRLHDIQPIDMQPQTFHVDTVSLWLRP